MLDLVLPFEYNVWYGIFSCSITYITGWSTGAC